MMVRDDRAQLEEEIGYNWEELSRLAKQIEKDIDDQFALLGSSLHQHQQRPYNAEQTQIVSLESMLKRLGNVTDMMGELLEQLGTTPNKNSSNSALHLLNRHKEVYQDYQRDLRKLKVYK